MSSDGTALVLRKHRTVERCDRFSSCKHGPSFLSRNVVPHFSHESEAMWCQYVREVVSITLKTIQNEFSLTCGLSTATAIHARNVYMMLSHLLLL